MTNENEKFSVDQAVKVLNGEGSKKFLEIGRASCRERV